MRLIPIFLMILLTSCSGAKTITADILTKTISTTIVSSLSCQDSTAVLTDVKREVDTWFGLKDAKSIGGDLCSAAVTAILPGLIGLTVPAVWACSGKAPADLAAQICKLIP